jgi:hypothetical protein
MTSTPAAAHSDRRLGGLLGALWETVLETPTADNPFTSTDPQDLCIDLTRQTRKSGARHRSPRVVAPFAPPGPSAPRCAVRSGTRILVTAYSSECSTIEAPPYFGRNDRELRACARNANAGYTEVSVAVDGKPVALSETDSGLIRADLPADNVFGVPAQRIYSVAQGWVALLHPLSRGTHEIDIHYEGVDVFGAEVDVTNTTTIVVTGRS